VANRVITLLQHLVELVSQYKLCNMCWMSWTLSSFQALKAGTSWLW
jgi:hypothetical protein